MFSGSALRWSAPDKNFVIIGNVGVEGANIQCNRQCTFMNLAQLFNSTYEKLCVPDK